MYMLYRGYRKMKYKVKVESNFLKEDFGTHIIEIKTQALLPKDTLTVIERVKEESV